MRHTEIAHCTKCVADERMRQCHRHIHHFHLSSSPPSSIGQFPHAPVTTKAPAATEMTYSQMNRRKCVPLLSKLNGLLSGPSKAIGKSDYNSRTEAMRLPAPSSMHQMVPTSMPTTMTPPMSGGSQTPSQYVSRTFPVPLITHGLHSC